SNTWNLETVRAYAECVADDCLDYGADILLGPGVNIKRNPLCGRNFEYYSEDPYLAGVIAREYIFAMQAEGAGACLKHFCANNLEYNRMQQSSEVDERTLREIYYKPFEIACEAKPVSIMCSYNKINGVQGSEYKKGFSALREEYGFDGAIISDWSAVYDRAKAAKAGLDLEMPFSQANYEKLLEDYKAGKILEEEIDQCAERVLDMVVRCKQFQQGKKRKRTQTERVKVSREVAEEGIVLLKNEGVLPLKKGKTISACGLYSAPYSADRDHSHCLVGGGSGKVARLTKEFDIPESLRKQGILVDYEVAFSDYGIENAFMNPRTAIENAAVSDINIVFAGTGSTIEMEGKDREHMKLSVVQERAILDTAAVNPNTVVVLFAGAPIDMSAWINEVAAVVWAGFPGERGDEAVANVLTGKVNPSGKLSETFPLCYEDTPASQGYI
ncbi:MAG: glycoside hydrolase family 3 C-terminal domain-containing protein, partial [Clostridia bacterium]|nr:glycoside hydrolase family 3 C-terminal domain-containing protein [Clostridia bacterium]